MLTECRDRYFMLAVDGSCVGNEPHFEAVGERLLNAFNLPHFADNSLSKSSGCVPDSTGVYPITERYAATCGYAVDVVPLRGHVELRASYFSCHTGNAVSANTVRMKRPCALMFHFSAGSLRMTKSSRSAST